MKQAFLIRSARPFSRLAAIVALSCMGASAASAEDWPGWRGPTGDGHSSETSVPVRWSAEENVIWTVALPGKSAASPIVVSGRVFVTSQTGESPPPPRPVRNPRRGDRRGQGSGRTRPPETLIPEAVANEGEFASRFLLHCFDAETGELLWEREDETEFLVSTHPKHNAASPTPVSDGERVYVWYAHGPVVCYDMDGNKIWRRDLTEENGPFVIKWGPASSPVLDGDRLILACDHKSNAYIAALDKRTGEDLWVADEALGGRSYSTPIFVETAERREMIFNTAMFVTAFDPENGKYLWRAEGLSRVVTPTPLYKDGIVYTSGGSRNAPMMAVRAGGEGDVTNSNVLWHNRNGAPYSASMIFVNGGIFAASARSVRCYDPATGEALWQARVDADFSASPVSAEGLIYVVDEKGTTYVFEASREAFKLVATNPLGERTLASPAISGGRIYIRTDDALYCIGESP